LLVADPGPFAGAVKRYLRHPLEGLVAACAFAVLGALSIDRASALGGWLGRNLGARLPLNRRAERNLRRAMPELDEAEIASIVRAMWDNLGRVVAELPHLHRFRLYDGEGRVEVVGAEHIDALRDDGIGGIFFSAHLGNWELASLCCTQRGLPLTHVYRAANNPYIERMIGRFRAAAISGVHMPKGPGTARELVAAIKRGEHLATLSDQKLREGIPVPFFGRDAMTTPIVAQLSLRFDCPAVPARVERLEGARFRLTLYPPLKRPQSGDREADVAAVARQMNAIFEDWIRARPAQWFWLHRRWPD
jgi:KDO2-lipid IV(A) lauroyltransferase